MTDDSNKQKAHNMFAHLMPKKVAQLVSLIEEGDRISGDELLIALREHEDGPLPEVFIEYLGKALSGWEEKKPGPKPKGYLYRSGEKDYLKKHYMFFTAALKGEIEETHFFCKIC